MLARIRQSLADHLELLLDAAGLAASFTGATAAAIFGRLMLALLLGAVVLGFYLRLARRRRKPPPQPVAHWVYGACGLLSAIEAGVLVEATDLPVRFGQEGFAMHHWLLVLLAFSVAFMVQLPLLKGCFRR